MDSILGRRWDGVDHDIGGEEGFLVNNLHVFVNVISLKIGLMIHQNVQGLILKP